MAFWPSYLASAKGRADVWSPEVAASLGVAAVEDRELRCAFSIISSCFDLSLARIGTKSFGTGVWSLKVEENIFKSLILMALSCETRSLLRSESLNFSKFANCRNETSTSDSTFAVAEELAIGTLFGTDGRKLAVITSLLSFATSFGASTGVASAPFAICESCFVGLIFSDVRSRKPLSG